MNREFQKSGDSGEGRLSNFVLLLLEMQGTEELRTMEVRLLQTYRIPGKEMGILELVTAFIKLARSVFPSNEVDVMQEESGIKG